MMWVPKAERRVGRLTGTFIDFFDVGEDGADTDDIAGLNPRLLKEPVTGGNVENGARRVDVDLEHMSSPNER
jgi:hypothetical protein